LQVLAVAIVIVVEEEYDVYDVPAKKQGFVRGDGGRYPPELGVPYKDRREKERPVAVCLGGPG
jgi:hypothetical protein